jgi:23S rRNA pseudouridine1911/1915/1917 synthase
MMQEYKDIEELEDVIPEEEEGLFEHYHICVDKGQSLLRIDKFLFDRLEQTSRNRIQGAADAGFIRVNGTAVKASYKVKPLDEISIVMPKPPREVEIFPEDIPLEILYEDKDLLLVNKPAGLVVHPGVGNYSGTLVNALAFHLKGEPMFESGDIRAGLVHRIDKNTSGILVVAKNEVVHRHLSKQFFDHTTERVYQALVWGTPKQSEGTIDINIGRSIKDPLKRQAFPDGELGKHAVTHYKVLESFGYVSLIECKLETGRTHQIRVHMSHIGHPLFMDEMYGGNKILKGTSFSHYKQFVEKCFQMCPRQALHAKVLGFEHPGLHQRMYFESDLPIDMEQCIEAWRVYVSQRN